MRILDLKMIVDKSDVMWHLYQSVNDSAASSSNYKGIYSILFGFLFDWVNQNSLTALLCQAG
ncbi:hypothetical protein D1BOALGB6SA_4498 [Olavius sp. associated proteobacterium Delta 1]|nr:hypothetical protein D1BOALGB6SA_4498 [Olavius sp. associated proteobacterium Delta 1]